MPSRLFTSTANFGQGFRQRQQVKQTAASLQQFQTLEIRGPWLGFQPDVDANLTDGTAFDLIQNVLARAYPDGELLGLPDGFRQIDPARLPLGDGATLPASPTTDADPVVRLDQITRTSPVGGTTPGDFTGEFQLTAMAVTAGDGVTNSSGNMYRLNASSQWTQVAPDASMTAARHLKAGRDGRTVSPSLPDSCVAPFGATARAVVGGGGGNGQSGPIQEPAWIFTNDFDEVMVFPSSSAESIAGTHVYEPLTSVATLDVGTDGNGFKAKSVECWNGRVYFLNTGEVSGGVQVRFPRRLRRTAKFTCDPDPAIVGSGFFDFTEFQGEGLRCETLGDVLAVYFTDGVAFVRPTGNPTSPDEYQIISSERGLLGTHCITPIGRNVHFGVFTDGWWLLDQSGRWQEVGIANINNKVEPKWRQTFYQDIPSNQRHRVYVYYDQPQNLVYIARPTNNVPSPGEIWIYDPTSDRVFIENYDVVCFGTVTPPAQAGVTIGALPGTIGGLPGTIGSFAPIPGFPKVRAHGDTAGFVYQHKREFIGFHGPERNDTPTVQNPTWIFGTGLRSPAGFKNNSTIDRLSIEYLNRGNVSSVSVEAIGPSADGIQSNSISLAGGNIGDVRSQDAWFRYTTQAPGFHISGAGEFQIRALSVDLWTDPLEPRK